MSIVVVGGGLAAANAVEELREQGYDGRIALLGAEPHLPYERPPLSKGLLLGNDEPESAFVHDAGWYAEHDVDLRPAAGRPRSTWPRHVVMPAASEPAYDRLLLATGADPRRLPLADDSGAPSPTCAPWRTAGALKEPRCAGRPRS